MSKLQLLASKFENLKLLDGEFVANFNIPLLHIENESFALVEKISEEKLVKKVLQSLPKKFHMKVTIIEEAQDGSSNVAIKVDELFGSLLTFKMSLDGKPDKNNKGIALQSIIEDVNKGNSGEAKDSLVDSISFMSKQFN